MHRHCGREQGWPSVTSIGEVPTVSSKVIDDRTIGYADYRGDEQFITTGNLGSDDSCGANTWWSTKDRHG